MWGTRTVRRLGCRLFWLLCIITPEQECRLFIHTGHRGEVIFFCYWHFELSNPEHHIFLQIFLMFSKVCDCISFFHIMKSNDPDNWSILCTTYQGTGIWGRGATSVDRRVMESRKFCIFMHQFCYLMAYWITLQFLVWSFSECNPNPVPGYDPTRKMNELTFRNSNTL